MNKKKLLIGVTVSGSAGLIKGQIEHYVKNGFDVHLLSSPGERVEKLAKDEGATLHAVNMVRDINILQDIKSLFLVFLVFLKVKPDIINVGTPKVSLLSMLASVPFFKMKKIYLVRGFRFESEKGLKKNLLIFFEKITSSIAHKIICISQSVKDIGVESDIFDENKAIVINKGSSNGVDLSKFDPSKISKSRKEELKESISINKNEIVFGFAGRIVDRKGVYELLEAFDLIIQKKQNVKLLILGVFEFDQLKDATIKDRIEKHSNILWVGYQNDVPLYMSIMDVFIMPAWWEGFGNVYIQAAAMGVPVIATKATGVKDAVSHNFNGILVTPKNVKEITLAMEKLINDEQLRTELGNNGIEWAKNFKPEVIWNGYIGVYNNLLQEKV